MSQSTDQVHAYPGLHVYVAPTGTTAPSSATSSLNAAFADLGYIDDDGAGMTPSTDTTDITSTQSFYPLLTLVTGKATDVAFTLLQVSEATWALAFGGGTWTGSAGAYAWVPPSASSRDERSVVIDASDGSVIVRAYFPRAVVSAVGTISFNKGSAATFPITMRVLGTAGVDPVQMWTSGYTAFSAT